MDCPPPDTLLHVLWIITPHQVAPEEDLEGPAALAAASADGRRPTARVVGIIRRNWRSRGYCGSLRPEELGPGSSTHSLLFVPVDRRYPMIR
jgi:exosome complex exonuclease DIS3/RRP44